MAGENNNLYLDTLYKLDANTKIDYFNVLYNNSDNILTKYSGCDISYIDEYRLKITDKYYKRIENSKKE